VNSRAKAIAIGCAVFLVTSVVTLAVPLPGWLLYGPAVVAGAAAAVLFRTENIYPFLLLGCANALMSGFISLVLTPFGMTDFPGWEGFFVAAFLSLPFVLVLTLVGSAIVGLWQRYGRA
jgi:hypothetical protein